MVKKSSFNALPLTALLALTGCATLPVPETRSASINGDPWEQVLERRVEPDGTIHFDELERDPAALRAAAREVAQTRLEDLSGPEEELAFAINAYNILAMRLVVDSDLEPRQKIRFFVLRKQHYLGDPVSLWTLENRIIRHMGEPRIHFALNCMVRGCPRLPREPFLAGTLEKQLREAAVEFLNDPRHVRYDSAGNVVHLSKILKWYRQDFESGDSGLIDYINRYRDTPVPASAVIEWLPYDWSLNRAED